VKVEWPLPQPLPLVSIIVPTKDKLELLQPCIESVLEQTDYDQFEIVIVDNGSVEERTADYLAAIGKNSKVRVIAYPHDYNFSAINNFAAHEARGTFLCLLNNDTEVVNAGWLTELMRYAVREDIGAAGAKLLYDDGTIQHAGVVIGIGDAAGHAHRFLPGHEPGYFCQPHVAQFVSAVTAACLVVEKRKFEAVGGLDENSLAVAFNDVDFCLKLEKAGWRNVYVPHAVLVHHESKSRGKDISPANIDRYQRELNVLQERWGTKTYEDPLHNPNLDRYSETFVIRL
jgi:GT2 family glycosyltransferase